MNNKNIINFFPKECEITEELIKSYGINIGEELLKSFLPKEFHNDIFWGLSIGSVKGIKIEISENIIFENKKIKVPIYLDRNIKPRKITFSLRNS